MFPMPWRKVALTLILLRLLNFLAVEYIILAEADKIFWLPGQPEVNFQQYSGYVSVDDNKQRALFYYFVEAESDPASKPLVLWLNGGPGCSSLGIGAFSEHGPFRPSGNVLVKNHYSWNRVANMLYLEAPVGVGFSYSKNGSKVNDRITARDNLVFLQRWFLKFPQYANRSLFVSGESYAGLMQIKYGHRFHAPNLDSDKEMSIRFQPLISGFCVKQGHYVPQLADLMLQFNNKKKIFNLKGVILGNPVLDFETDFNSPAEYFWSHGLISDSTYEMFTSSCNYSRYLTEAFSGNLSPLCSKVMNQVNQEKSKFVNDYDVILDVCISPVLSQSKIISSKFVGETIIDVCVEDETVAYLNRKDVQQALYARLVGVDKWIMCSDTLDYYLTDVRNPTITILGRLVKAGIRVLVYNGDQDSVIPLTGSRTLIKRLAKELKLETTVPYRAWFSQKQVGGWNQVYGNILSYATIRGASHEAPLTQPERSLVLFKTFLEGRHLPETFGCADSSVELNTN